MFTIPKNSYRKKFKNINFESTALRAFVALPELFPSTVCHADRACTCINILPNHHREVAVKLKTRSIYDHGDLLPVMGFRLADIYAITSILYGFTIVSPRSSCVLNDFLRVKYLNNICRLCLRITVVGGTLIKYNILILKWKTYY